MFEGFRISLVILEGLGSSGSFEKGLDLRVVWGGRTNGLRSQKMRKLRIYR